jgi:hypothetical protein
MSPKAMSNLVKIPIVGVGVSIFQVGDEIFGKGTIIQRNNAERFGAFGSEDKDKLNLDLIILDNYPYRLDL